VQGLEDPSVVRERVTEVGWVAAVREHPDDVMRADRTRVNRRDGPQDVRPMPAHAAQVDPAAPGRLQRPVVGAEVDAPQLGATVIEGKTVSACRLERVDMKPKDLRSSAQRISHAVEKADPSDLTTPREAGLDDTPSG